ncbi:hypothetical protein [Pseudorhodoferax sp. Leaf267]|uniref:hypothetical protein n=1 Tax=Pseudorhodoferax sp. Leaf267 TaxID=1736316 RepID=UPI0012E20549|nr:hypothetical protein [Pseudorhodoferax sp. Leaf267]
MIRSICARFEYGLAGLFSLIFMPFSVNAQVDAMARLASSMHEAAIGKQEEVLDAAFKKLDLGKIFDIFTDQIEVMTELSADDLKISTIEVKKVDFYQEQWIDVICRSLLRESSPFGDEQYPIIILSIPIVFQEKFQETSWKKIVEECPKVIFGPRQPIVFPLGIFSFVALQAKAEMLPNWLPPSYITAASLVGQPCSPPWKINSKNISKKSCVALKVQPSQEEFEKKLDNFDSNDCLMRDNDSNLILGTNVYATINQYKKENLPGPISGNDTFSYSSCFLQPNQIVNWADIDMGIRDLDVEIATLGDTKSSHPRRFSRYLCSILRSDQMVQNYDEQIQRCSLASRVSIYSDILSIPYNENRLLLVSTDYYVRSIRTNTLLQKLTPLYMPPPPPGRTWDSFIPSYSASHAVASSPFGYVAWVVMDPRAFESAKVKEYFEYVRKGPLKSGYHGTLAFFSDIHRLRYYD